MRETWRNHTWREPKLAIDGNTTPDVIELTPKGGGGGNSDLLEGLAYKCMSTDTAPYMGNEMLKLCLEKKKTTTTH